MVDVFFEEFWSLVVFVIFVGKFCVGYIVDLGVVDFVEGVEVVCYLFRFGGVVEFNVEKIFV